MKSAIFGPLAIILSLSILGPQQAQADSQPTRQCSLLLQLGPAANDSKDDALIAAFNKEHSALYNGSQIQVSYQYEQILSFYTELDVIEMEITKGGEYLIAKGEYEARIYDLKKYGQLGSQE